jgi:hypothetical protein
MANIFQNGLQQAWNYVSYRAQRAGNWILNGPTTQTFLVNKEIQEKKSRGQAITEEDRFRFNQAQAYDQAKDSADNVRVNRRQSIGKLASHGVEGILAAFAWIILGFIGRRLKNVVQLGRWGLRKLWGDPPRNTTTNSRSMPPVPGIGNNAAPAGNQRQAPPLQNQRSPSLAARLAAASGASSAATLAGMAARRPQQRPAGRFSNIGPNLYASLANAGNIIPAARNAWNNMAPRVYQAMQTARQNVQNLVRPLTGRFSSRPAGPTP